MFPVCSTAPSGSPLQISFLGGLSQRSYGPFWTTIKEKCTLMPNGIHTPELSFKASATEFEYINMVETPGQSGCTKFMNISSYMPIMGDGGVYQKFSASPDDAGEILNGFPDELYYCEPQEKSYLIRMINESYPINEIQKYVEKSHISASEPSQIMASESLSIIDATDVTLTENPDSVFATIDITNDSLPNIKENFENVLSGFNNYVETNIGKLNDVVTDSVNNTTESIENAVRSILSSANNSSNLAGKKLMDLASELTGTAYKAGSVAVTVLRQGIVATEDYLANAGNFVLYSYKSAKAVLPSEAQNVLNSSEEATTEILRPVGTAFQQVYIALERLEKDFGLDPNDPIVQFLQFLGIATTLGVSYWVFKYGGYSGDLSPKSTFELLTNEESAVLIDVRPEDLRATDGVPDLRRAARFKYTSVTLPKMDDSLRKLLKSGKELDNALIAAVIRNLKIVRDSSKVIVMDANGAEAKGIARSLRKLGIKRPYLVQGGFGSWVASGLRVKELRPETTLTILNEDTEAILEDIKPTPVKVITYGVGLISAIYALLEWEKTLQFIGLIGLGQTIYRRVASYEDSEDLKQDVRVLLAPARFGAQAISWAAGKLQPNKMSNNLPTSPSSLDVQNRVLQAAAKLGSQPSDLEETKDSSTAPPTENLDLSEA